MSAHPISVGLQKQMPASSAIKQLFAERHKPLTPIVRVNDRVVAEVEAFLFLTNALEAYAELTDEGNNFTINPVWISKHGENSVVYSLDLTLFILADEGAPIEIGIPEDSGLWNAIITASEIDGVAIEIPYPTGA